MVAPDKVQTIGKKELFDIQTVYLYLADLSEIEFIF